MKSGHQQVGEINDMGQFRIFLAVFRVMVVTDNIGEGGRKIPLLGKP